jgi:hypothetical protein
MAITVESLSLTAVPLMAAPADAPFGSPPEDCNRLGRLPWKTLRLPDLRDGAGERLWYAVGTNFKTNTRSDCDPLSPDPFSGCLNSDAKGTITVLNHDSVPVYNASDPDPLTSNGVAAVVIAPGKVLRRQGDTGDQTKTCTGTNCAPDDPCPGPAPYIGTPICNPRNLYGHCARRGQRKLR